MLMFVGDCINFMNCFSAVPNNAIQYWLAIYNNKEYRQTTKINNTTVVLKSDTDTINITFLIYLLMLYSSRAEGL